MQVQGAAGTLESEVTGRAECDGHKLQHVRVSNRRSLIQVIVYSVRAQDIFMACRKADKALKEIHNSFWAQRTSRALRDERKRVLILLPLWTDFWEASLTGCGKGGSWHHLILLIQKQTSLKQIFIFIKR